MKVNKVKFTPEEMALIEYTAAQTAANAANIDYIAMMTDVELPDEEEKSDEC